ncbi:MAG: hypothetical protein MJZ89_06040 [Paludibacteraceae bacterium]|nr:hypothetical protein [Paludibacteraceae bacterium]
MITEYQLSKYIAEHHPVWACEMPKGCPPEDILVATEQSLTLYMVENNGF